MCCYVRISGCELLLAFTDCMRRILCKLYPTWCTIHQLLSSNTSTCMLKSISILSFSYVSLFFFGDERRGGEREEELIHLVVCLTRGPKPLPKRTLHMVRSRASSFKWEYPLLSLRSSDSFLRLLPCLPVTSIPHCVTGISGSKAMICIDSSGSNP